MNWAEPGVAFEMRGCMPLLAPVGFICGVSSFLLSIINISLVSNMGGIWTVVIRLRNPS